MQDIEHIRLVQTAPGTYDIDFIINPTVTTTSDPLAILLQMVVRLCMTTPGTDDFFSSAGAGFQKVVEKMPRDQGHADEIRIQVHDGIKDVDRQIRSYQSRDTTIKPAGRLKRLSVESRSDIAIIESTGIMIVPLLIETYDGNATRLAAPFVKAGG